MAGIIGRIKRALPWWAKIPAKVVLSRLPVGPNIWQRLGLFSPGQMMDPVYAHAVFDTHYRRVGAPGPSFTFLELGPGDSFASAVIGRAYGARQIWLFDTEDYASRDMAIYRRLITYLTQVRPGFDPGALIDAQTTDALLALCNATYKVQDGLKSLRQVPDASCDMIFSQAVLEHIPKGCFEETLAEMRRILKPHGLASHQIDYRDHLDGGLNNLRFPEALWEASWFARRSGFYTNRIRPAEMMRAFEAVGFAITVIKEERWDAPPIARAHLAHEFRDTPEDDLLIKDRCVLLTHATTAIHTGAG